MAYRLKHYDFGNIYVCGRSPALPGGRTHIETTDTLRYAKVFETAEEAREYIKGCANAHIYDPALVEVAS